MPTQRLGSSSRAVFYPETTWNEDPGTPVGYVMPLRDQSGFGSSDSLIEAPIFTGNALPFGVINGLVNAEGAFPLALEFITIGHFLKTYFGSDGYARPGGGTTSLHHWFIPTASGAVPGSAQVQSSFQETTAQHIRNKGCRVGGFSFSQDIAGAVSYSMDMIGSGKEATTDLGGTVTDNGYSAASYFNGKLKKGSTSLASLAQFSLALACGLSRQDVAFNDGYAGAINQGIHSAKGRLELLFGDDLSFYNEAVNQNEVSLDCLWANGPLSSATRWLRVQMPTVRFARTAPRPGGSAGLLIGQDYMMIRSDNADVAAEAFGPTLGTYNVTLTTDVLGVKIDGGATISTTLTASATKTAAQVVAELQANGSLTAVADVDEFNGRVRITSKTKGSSSSVQIDTAVVDSAHSLFGFDGVARTGRNDCPLLVSIYNNRTSDY